jgi:hypothetical protein
VLGYITTGQVAPVARLCALELEMGPELCSQKFYPVPEARWQPVAHMKGQGLQRPLEPSRA